MEKSPESDQSNRAHVRLLQLGRELNTAPTLDYYLQMLVDCASELTGSDASSILLYEQETGLLKFIAGPHYQRDRLRRLRVPVEHSVAGEAFQKREPVIIRPEEGEGRVFSTVDQELFFRTRSLLAVPLAFRGEPMGVMEAVNKPGLEGYTQNDVEILETLGAFAANAIFNTLLFDEASTIFQDLADLEQKKSDFIAIAAHELRTPLGLVLGHATYLQDLQIDPKYQRHLEAIVKGCMRMKELLDDMASVESEESAPGRLKRHTVAVGEVISEVVQGFQVDARQKRIILRTDLPATPLAAEGDAEKIVIALENLVRNALAFTDPGGLVLVRGEKLPGYVKVSVIDNGIGIPARDQAHIFERFYQVEAHNVRRHGGMGLGLSVARVMVKLHGGDIWVESVEGKGSNFTFILPERAPQGAAERSIFQPRG